MIFNDHLTYVANRAKITSNGSMRVTPTITVDSIPDSLEAELTAMHVRALGLVQQGRVTYDGDWIANSRSNSRISKNYEFLEEEGLITRNESVVELTEFGSDFLSSVRKSGDV